MAETTQVAVLRRMLAEIVEALDKDMEELSAEQTLLAFESLDKARAVLAMTIPDVVAAPAGLMMNCCGQALQECGLPGSEAHEPDGRFQEFGLTCGWTYDVTGHPPEEEDETPTG